MFFLLVCSISQGEVKPNSNNPQVLSYYSLLNFQEFLSMNGLTRLSYWTSWYLVAIVIFLPTTLLNLLVRSPLSGICVFIFESNLLEG